MSLASGLEEVRNELSVSVEYLDELVDFFVNEAAQGLERDTERGIPMIPSFVTKMPNGEERGLFLAADLGGSNFRVCSVNLNGDRTHEIKQMKWKVPAEIMRGKAADFWSYLADCVVKFLKEQHPDRATYAHDDLKKLKMGFTFSFPIHQTGLNRGKLIRWTKGYDIKDAVGTDICVEFQAALDARGMPVDIAAIVNDTVGCLLSRSYETGDVSQTMIGCILGTGTNAAYSEKIKAIKKLQTYDSGSIPQGANIMVINTEWGSFDNDLKILPNTKYDKAVNLATPNPDFHMFEKRVSGMFLGEICRRIFADLYEKGILFKDSASSIAAKSPLFTPWSTDTSLLSFNAADKSADLAQVNEQLIKLGVPQSSLEERKAVKEISHLVALRSAKLVAGIIAGLLKMTKAFEKFKVVDIGMDGAVIEFYPHYEEMIRESLRSIASVGDKEDRITIGISKDGSGIGAALCAAMAM